MIGSYGGLWASLRGEVIATMWAIRDLRSIFIHLVMLFRAPCPLFVASYWEILVVASRKNLQVAKVTR